MPWSGRIAVLALLALPLAACSSSMKISSRELCEASGGTYSNLTCNPGSSRSAQAICQAHGGLYLSGEDNCDIPYSQ